MKNKIIFTIFGIIASALAFCGRAIAIDEGAIVADEVVSESILQFRAVNAGYKNDESAQNYDFVELIKTTSSDIDISPYEIQYFNSNDNLSGTISFPELSIFRGDRLVLGFAKSPQYSTSPSHFLYDFGSSGLASTAGRLRLILDGNVVDELCWGKIVCDNSLAKFSTNEDENKTAILCHLAECNDEERYQDYYPDIVDDALDIIEPSLEPALDDGGPNLSNTPSCRGAVFNELFSYYSNAASEQYIELYNASSVDISLDSCTLRYKNKDYPLHGGIASNGFTLIQDIVLTKDPSSALMLELRDESGVVDAMSYSHGQKKDVAVARFGEK